MRVPALALATIGALAGCGGDDNTVTSGFPGLIISPVRSSITAAVNLPDANGVMHPQWVIAMTDAPNLCTKVAANPAYFQTPIENFAAILLWIPPGNLGTFFIGTTTQGGSSANTEVVVGAGPASGSPGVLKFPGVGGLGANIVVNQFNTGPGGEAI